VLSSTPCRGGKSSRRKPEGTHQHNPHGPKIFTASTNSWKRSQYSKKVRAVRPRSYLGRPGDRSSNAFVCTGNVGYRFQVLSHENSTARWNAFATQRLKTANDQFPSAANTDVLLSMGPEGVSTTALPKESPGSVTSSTSLASPSALPHVCEDLSIVSATHAASPAYGIGAVHLSSGCSVNPRSNNSVHREKGSIGRAKRSTDSVLPSRVLPNRPKAGRSARLLKAT